MCWYWVLGVGLVAGGGSLNEDWARSRFQAQASAEEEFPLLAQRKPRVARSLADAEVSSRTFDHGLLCSRWLALSYIWIGMCLRPCQAGSSLSSL
ncbi:hypothetical protein F5Y10DRAFT_120848 [Nemania abortiva]|nr:hypothetical protein F5Y10DRAFT_120848 [Nemania abortiva]